MCFTHYMKRLIPLHERGEPLYRNLNAHSFRGVILYRQIDQPCVSNDRKTTDPCVIVKRSSREKTGRKEETHLLGGTAKHRHQRLFQQGDVCGKPCLYVEIGPHETANGDGARSSRGDKGSEGKSAKHGVNKRKREPPVFNFFLGDAKHLMKYAPLYERGASINAHP